MTEEDLSTKDDGWLLGYLAGTVGAYSASARNIGVIRELAKRLGVEFPASDADFKRVLAEEAISVIGEKRHG